MMAGQPDIPALELLRHARSSAARQHLAAELDDVVAQPIALQKRIDPVHRIALGQCRQVDLHARHRAAHGPRWGIQHQLVQAAAGERPGNLFIRRRHGVGLVAGTPQLHQRPDRHIHKPPALVIHLLRDQQHRPHVLGHRHRLQRITGIKPRDPAQLAPLRRLHLDLFHQRLDVTLDPVPRRPSARELDMVVRAHRHAGDHRRSDRLIAMRKKHRHNQQCRHDPHCPAPAHHAPLSAPPLPLGPSAGACERGGRTTWTSTFSIRSPPVVMSSKS